jgi:POT family proton-dependent oligopeptide transporter
MARYAVAMKRPAFPTAAISSARMPPGIPYIVGNEAAERFSFYGMRAILVVFMTRYLRDRSGAPAVMGENEAGGWYHAFVASNYFFPIFGAILADTLWGKYRTILWLSLVYCCGHAALAADDSRLGLAAGLTLIALGAGGIKPCVSANVGDQFGPSNSHLLSRAFSWFYFSVNAGSFISILLIPAILERRGPHAAFAVPGVLMLLATVVFWSGRHKFVHVPPRPESFWRELSRPEGLLALGRLAVLYAFVAVFWSLWDQSGGEWVLQAAKMDLHFAGVTWLPSQVQAVNALLILVLIPFFQYIIYPACDRFFPLTPLRKIGFGLLIAGGSFVVSAWIESRIRAGVRPNIAWQLPAFALLTAGEVLVSITALEFAYTQAPRAMKSVVMALYLLSVSAGNAFTALVHVLIQKPDGSTRIQGTAYYLFFAILAAATAAIFAVFASRYRGRDYLREEASP